MIESLVQMLIGAGATVGYLTVWQRILAATSPEHAGDDETMLRRLRQRRRLAQLILFVLLTPYVLLVFRVMDAARAWLQT